MPKWEEFLGFNSYDEEIKITIEKLTDNAVVVVDVFKGLDPSCEALLGPSYFIYNIKVSKPSIPMI